MIVMRKTCLNAGLAKSGGNHSENVWQEFVAEKIYPYPLFVAVGHAFESIALDLYWQSENRQRPVTRFRFL